MTGIFYSSCELDEKPFRDRYHDFYCVELRVAGICVKTIYIKLKNVEIIDINELEIK